jgi:hypothetical protein
VHLLEFATSTCSLSAGLYTHSPCGGEKHCKNWFWYRTFVRKIFDNFKKPTFLTTSSLPVFHKNCQFFDVSEITGTSGYLILIFFSKNRNQQFFDSENFKELLVI